MFREHRNTRIKGREQGGKKRHCDVQVGLGGRSTFLSVANGLIPKVPEGRWSTTVPPARCKS
jgi:hypothetical protein